MNKTSGTNTMTMIDGIGPDDLYVNGRFMCLSGRPTESRYNCGQSMQKNKPRPATECHECVSFTLLYMHVV